MADFLSALDCLFALGRIKLIEERGYCAMLKEIRCDKFAPNHQVIKLNEGLNTVLGSSSGTNAIGNQHFCGL